MNVTIRRIAVSLAIATLTAFTSVTIPAFSVPSVTSTIAVGDSPVSEAFSPDGKKAYVVVRSDF